MVHNFMLNLSTTAATLEEEICEHVSKGVNSNLGGVWVWWLGFFGVVFCWLLGWFLGGVCFVVGLGVFF